MTACIKVRYEAYDGMSSDLGLTSRDGVAERKSVDVFPQDAETDIQGIPEVV